MKINVLQRRAVAMCLAKHIPFALWALPDSETPSFAFSMPDREGCSIWPDTDKQWNGFFINFFGNDEPYTAGISASFNEQDLDLLKSMPDLPPTDMQPRDSSMDYFTYLALSGGLIKSLEQNDEKVVFSRIIAQWGPSDVLAVSERYFDGLPSTFRYLCYTHETGLWLGATPELVADYNLATRRLKTEALAGTRSISESGPWDTKNLAEHRIVPASIAQDITNMGGHILTVKAVLDEKHFGDITHLHTAIEADMPDMDVRSILTALSPTSAIGGNPSNVALKKIFTWETHSRYCYGGFVGVKEGLTLKAFANIRCAFVGDEDNSGQRLYNIYTGGGLVKNSKPKIEWLETEAKSQRLVKAITQK